MMTHEQKSISETIYFAKGIGIFLVVAGHLFVPEQQPDYWIFIRGMIYKFHIHVFMLVSGILFAYGDVEILSANDFWEFFRKKFKRLMLPYLTISLIVLSLKLCAGNFFELFHPVDMNAFYYFFLNPMAEITPGGGFATFLWFIYTLFTIFVLVGFLLMFTKNPWMLFLFSIVSLFIKWPNFFCLNLAFRFLPIFLFGYLIVKIDWILFTDKVVGFVIFSIFFAVLFFGKEMIPFSISGRVMIFLLGLSGSLSVFFGASFFTLEKMRGYKVIKIFKQLGMSSATIYLLHIICMGPLSLFFYKVLNIGSSQFLYVAPLIWCCGLFLPIAIEKKLLQPYPAVSQLILGK